MQNPYVPFLILFGFVIANAAGMLLLSHFLSARRPTSVKEAPYESGMPALGSAHERFSIKFYMVAMLFIVFDIETVFLIPWGVVFRQLGLFGLVEMIVFMVILFAGYVYIWKRGALEWD
jgi:NADH-quinone oxidoreductase subunit A